MSEEKKPRTISDVQQDYQSSCTRLGHLEYQIFTLKKDAELIKSQLRDLNLEAASIQKAEADAKAESESK